MERDVRHPHLFTLCGFLLCFVFLSNLAYAGPKLKVHLNMENFADSKFKGYVLVYDRPQAMESISKLRVLPGSVQSVEVMAGEWVAVSVVLINHIVFCQDYQDEHRLKVGEGALIQDVVITPRLTVEHNSTVCRLDMTAAQAG